MRIATIAIVCSIKSAMLVSCALFAVFLSLLTTEPHAFAASCSFPLSQAIGESCDGLASSGNGNIDNSGVIGDINNIEVAVRNYGNISLFANTGSISSSIWGIVNSGTISNFVNNGIVRAGYEAFLNYGNTILLVNRGSFIGDQYYGLGNRGNINEIQNYGVLQGKGANGINMYPDNWIGSLFNKFGGQIIGPDSGINTAGKFDFIQNDSGALIQGIQHGVWNRGFGFTRIGTIINNGIISGIVKYGIFNDDEGVVGSIESINNFGRIEGGVYGVFNKASIANISNMGIISGLTFDISNSAVIDVLVNAQGGSSILPLTYKGNLPSSYYIYIASASHYGQISFTDGTGVMNVSVELAGGVRPVNLYSSVISGIDASHIGNTTGSVNGWNWRLEQVGLAWNLVFLGPNVYDTYADLARSANNIRNTIALRSSSMALMMDYDCRAFAQYNTCISFGGRYGDLNASTNEGAGMLTAAYRVSPSMRIGAFIDHRVTQSKPAGIRYSDDTPSVGAFIGYDDHGDGTGAQGKLTAVYNTGKVGVTRLASSANTEAGSGRSALTSYAVGAELGWGIQLNDGWVGTPYAGIKHTSSKLGAYAEQLTDSVTFPISYADYGQRLTTATVGGRIDGRMTERVSIALAAGIERDLRSTIDAYAGTSDIPGLTSFSLSNSANINRSRAVGSAALSYQIANNQRVSAGMSVRENAYVSQPTRAMQMKYEMAF